MENNFIISKIYQYTGSPCTKIQGWINENPYYKKICSATEPLCIKGRNAFQSFRDSTAKFSSATGRFLKPVQPYVPSLQSFALATVITAGIIWGWKSIPEGTNPGLPLNGTSNGTQETLNEQSLSLNGTCQPIPSPFTAEKFCKWDWKSIPEGTIPGLPLNGTSNGTQETFNEQSLSLNGTCLAVPEALTEETVCLPPSHANSSCPILQDLDYKMELSRDSVCSAPQSSNTCPITEPFLTPPNEKFVQKPIEPVSNGQVSKQRGASSRESSLTYRIGSYFGLTYESIAAKKP